MAKQILTDLDFNSVSRLQNLLDAVSDQEPATLAQVKQYLEGLAWKDDVQTVSTANINLGRTGRGNQRRDDGEQATASLAKDQSAGPKTASISGTVLQRRRRGVLTQAPATST
jgi:hypothetical protein